jgi:uncharacterized membrane protein
MDRITRRLASFWIGAGVMHFVIPRQYAAIVPEMIPRKREVVVVSGLAEIAGGVAVLHPRTRTPARWWLLTTLVAVFPANINMALHPERYPKIPRWALLARLPLQGVCALFTWKGTAAR